MVQKHPETPFWVPEAFAAYVGLQKLAKIKKDLQKLAFSQRVAPVTTSGFGAWEKIGKCMEKIYAVCYLLTLPCVHCRIIQTLTVLFQKAGRASDPQKKHQTHLTTSMKFDPEGANTRLQVGKPHNTTGDSTDILWSQIIFWIAV